MINKIKPAIVIYIFLCNLNYVCAAPPEVTRFTLSNGIKVVNLYVEDSTDAIILSYLPLGLVSDGKAKAQWSHLIEHLTIRTTGPIDFKTSSAETMTDNMRLEFLGSTDNWIQGLDLHTKWLSGLPYSEQSLVEELPNALSEIDMTVQRLATHKWAAAAWNQVFRHGETDVSMYGDIKSAKLGDLEEYRDLHLVQKDRVLLCVIGGIDTETLQPAMEEKIGAINISAKSLPPATVKDVKKKDRIATWDVNVTHYIETYTIPNAKNNDYPALYIANALLNVGLIQDTQLKQLTGIVHSSIDIVTPEQTYLQINASVKQDAEINNVRERIRSLIDHIMKPENNSQVVMAAQSLSMQFSSPMDIDIMKQYKQKGVTEAMMLGNIGLWWGMLEFRYGDNLPHIANALKNVSADDVADVANRYLSEDKQMTLVLIPHEKE